MLPGMIVTGAGLGMAASPLAASAVGVVPPWKSGMASGINSTFRQLGLAVGLAALGAIFQSTVNAKVVAAFARTPVAHLSHTFAKLISSGGTQRLITATPAPRADLFTMLLSLE